jgi:hypothetical protein
LPVAQDHINQFPQAGAAHTQYIMATADSVDFNSESVREYLGAVADIEPAAKQRLMTLLASFTFHKGNNIANMKCMRPNINFGKINFYFFGHACSPIVIMAVY